MEKPNFVFSPHPCSAQILYVELIKMEVNFQSTVKFFLEGFSSPPNKKEISEPTNEKSVWKVSF